MNIKKRLTISNVLMLLVPIILIILIASVLLERFTEAYQSQLISYAKEFVYGGEKGFYVGIEYMLSQMKSLIISYMGIIILTSIFIVVLTNSILTSRLAKSILKPLDLLRYGSQQIKEGNLDFELKYDSKDEFEQVCSDFNEMRLRLKDSIEMQLKYEEDRKELVAGISHDLRTPLTAIKGYVEGLRDGVANTPEKQQNYLDTIYKKACIMDSLVDSLSLFSKMDTNRYPFHFEKLEMGGYLKEYYNQIKAEFQLKGLEISFENKCKNEILVKLDREEMGRVLTNILENSVKYKIIELGKVKANLEQVGSSIVLTIADNGPGVETDDLTKLFTRFYRGDPSRTNPHEGSGLGLAIAKHIVNAHDGTIVAHNNDGLEIEITLPMIVEENQ